MTGIILAYPDIALFSDPNGTRVVLPRIRSQQRNHVREQTMVRFEGDEEPTQFRGEGSSRVYPLVARFFHAEHATMKALLDLFDAAHAAPDGRLLLRTNAFLVAGLNPVEAIVALDPQEMFIGGQAWDVSWTAQTVKYSIEV